MTREEAINIMKVIVHMLEEKYDTDRVEEAVEMAIQSLTAISELSKSLKAVNRYEMDEKVLIGFNMAVAIFNKCFGEIGEMSERQTDGDLISRDKAIELVNYALAENKDVLELLENMPSAEQTDSSIPQEDVADILNIVESALKGTNYEVVGYDNTDGFLKVLIDVK